MPGVRVRLNQEQRPAIKYVRLLNFGVDGRFSVRNGLMMDTAKAILDGWWGGGRQRRRYA